MSPSLFLLPITYHFFTVLLVLWVFIVRREIITESPNHRADIPRACFLLDSSAMSIRIFSSVSLRFSLPFVLFFSVRDTCAPIIYAIFSFCSQLDLVKAIVDATTDRVVFNFPSSHAAFVRSTSFFRSLPSSPTGCTHCIQFSSPCRLFFSLRRFLWPLPPLTVYSSRE